MTLIHPYILLSWLNQAKKLIFFVSIRHQGSFHIAHIKDSAGNDFATRLQNVFIIGKENRPWISIPKGKGIKISILEERNLRAQKRN